MGVYIKGQDLPKEGEHYLIQINSDGTVYDAVGRRIAAQAVSVPPHGDLIDREALMMHKGNCYDADGHLLYAVGTGNILRAPTIIPADPAEEGE